MGISLVSLIDSVDPSRRICQVEIDESRLGQLTEDEINVHGEWPQSNSHLPSHAFLHGLADIPSS